MAGFYFPYCDDGIDVCCIEFGKKLLNLIHGVARLIVFLMAVAPLITDAFVIQSSITTYITGYSTVVCAFMITWTIVRTVMEALVCLIIIADTIVSTDSPFGYNVDAYTFLFLAKLPPDVIRGVLWLLLSGFSSKEVLLFFSTNYNSTSFALMSITLDTGRKLLIIPGLFWTIFNLIRFRKYIFTLEEGLKFKTTDTLSANHWYMTRYYEKETLLMEPKTQRIKHRLDKVMFLLSPIVAIVSQCFTFYLTYSVIVASSPTSGTIFPGVPSTSVTYILVQALYYIDLIVPYVVNISISIMLIVYILILLCTKVLIVFHWMVKALLLYNLLSCMPSASTLLALVTLSLNQAISTEVTIWLSVCIPFLAFLPAFMYFFTRSPYMLLQETTGVIKNFLQICLNFLNPSKIFRTFHILSICFGVCGLLLLLFGLPLSWLTVDFNMDANLSALKLLHTSLDTKIGNIEATFENVLGSLSCAPLGDTINNKAILDQLKSHNPQCFNSSYSSNKNCTAIVSAYDNATDTTRYDSICISDDNVCIAFMAMNLAGFALAVVPFAGAAGKAMIMTARTMKEMHKLMKILSKVRSKVITYKKLLDSLSMVLRKVTWVVAFVITSEYLLVLLPCVALGAICLSIGFWKRVPIEGLFNRGVLSFITIGFVVTNIPIGLFVWFAAPILQSVLDIAPLFDVTVSEETGWKMLKVAYACSSISALLACIYTAGDTIIALLSRLLCVCKCCGCSRCETFTVKCRRYAEYVDLETDISNPDAKVNKDIEMTDKRLIVNEDDNPDIEQMNGDDKKYLVSNEVFQPRRITVDKRERVAKTLVITKIATPSAWFMPLCPALFAGLLVAFVIFYKPPMYVVYTRLNGEVSSLQSEISVSSNSVVDGVETMGSEKTLCDLITAAVTAPFRDLFDALTPSIIPEIATFVTNMKIVFTIPTSVSFSGWAHFIFSGLPGLACFFFILGFLLTLTPCFSEYTKSFILGQLKQLILIIVLTSLSFSLTAAMAIQRLIEHFPLVEITVEYGLAIQLSLLANFILLLAWVELTISSYAPII